MVVTSVDWVRAYVPHGEACLVNRVHTCPIGQPPEATTILLVTSILIYLTRQLCVLRSCGIEHS